jgi:hypothetical protein
VAAFLEEASATGTAVIKRPIHQHQVSRASWNEGSIALEESGVTKLRDARSATVI